MSDTAIAEAVQYFQDYQTASGCHTPESALRHRAVTGSNSGYMGSVSTVIIRGGAVVDKIFPADDPSLKIRVSTDSGV